VPADRTLADKERHYIRDAEGQFSRVAGVNLHIELENPGGQAAAERAKAALAKVLSVDEAFTVEELPDEDFAAGRAFFTRGALGVHSDQPKTVVPTVVHEYGHLLDYQILGKPDEPLTATDEFTPIWQELRATPTMQAVLKDEWHPILAGDIQTRNYLLQGREMFARAFTQYITRRSGDSELTAQLESKQRDEVLGCEVWQDDEFEPIMLAFDELFDKAGILPDERATGDADDKPKPSSSTTLEVPELGEVIDSRQLAMLVDQSNTPEAGEERRKYKLDLVIEDEGGERIRTETDADVAWAYDNDPLEHASSVEELEDGDTAHYVLTKLPWTEDEPEDEPDEVVPEVVPEPEPEPEVVPEPDPVSDPDAPKIGEIIRPEQIAELVDQGTSAEAGRQRRELKLDLVIGDADEPERVVIPSDADVAWAYRNDPVDHAASVEDMKPSESAYYVLRALPPTYDEPEPEPDPIDEPEVEVVPEVAVEPGISPISIIKPPGEKLTKAQAKAAAKKVIADVAADFGYTGKLPEFEVRDSAEMEYGFEAGVRNGNIVVTERWLEQATSADYGVMPFRQIAHEAVHIEVSRVAEVRGPNSKMIEEGAAEFLSIDYWNRRGQPLDERDALRRDGAWDHSLAATSVYQEEVGELMTRAASRLYSWDREAVRSEIERVMRMDHNGRIEFRDETRADFPPPAGFESDGESLLRWYLGEDVVPERELPGGWKAGDRVHSEAYGLGTVTGGDEDMVEIQFDDGRSVFQFPGRIIREEDVPDMPEGWTLGDRVVDPRYGQGTVTGTTLGGPGGQMNTLLVVQFDAGARHTFFPTNIARQDDLAARVRNAPQVSGFGENAADARNAVLAEVEVDVRAVGAKVLARVNELAPEAGKYDADVQELARVEQEIEDTIQAGGNSLPMDEAFARLEPLRERRFHLETEIQDRHHRALEQRQDAILTALREVRPGYGQGLVTNVDAGDERSRNLLQEAAQYLPLEWVQKSNEQGRIREVKVAGSRGLHRSHGRSGDSTIEIRNDPMNALHELAHRMQHVMSDVHEIEFAFYRRRTMRANGKQARKVRLDSKPGGWGYGAKEVTRGAWTNPYIGKDYAWMKGQPAQPHEILTMSLEGLFGGRFDLFGGTPDPRRVEAARNRRRNEDERANTPGMRRSPAGTEMVETEERELELVRNGDPELVELALGMLASF
jgi:hypothetical protein